MGIDLNQLNATVASIKISDGTDSLAIDGSGNISVNQAGTWNIGTVSTITNVVHIDDNSGSLTVDGTVAATQSGTWDIGTLSTITNVVHIDDNSGSITVDASNLDIRDLTHASDSVKIGDGTDFLAIDGSGNISVNQAGAWNVNTVPGGYSAWQTSAVSVANTATQIASTPLSGRLSITIQNIGNQDMYIGATNAVTTATGLLIAKGFSQEIELDGGAAIYGITATSTTDVRIAEYKA